MAGVSLFAGARTVERDGKREVLWVLMAGVSLIAQELIGQQLKSADTWGALKQNGFKSWPHAQGNRSAATSVSLSKTEQSEGCLWRFVWGP
jgi:hypothetical protein